MKVRVGCKCGWRGVRTSMECACYDEWTMYCRPESPGPGCPSGVVWPCPKCKSTPFRIYPRAIKVPA